MSDVPVKIDFAKVRQNVREIVRASGVDVIGVVKADAYGLGVISVVQAIDDLVAGYCVFSFAEATGVRAITQKVIMTLGPSEGIDAEEFVSQRVRPAVWTVAEATRLRAARPIISVDTGMRRFACERSSVDAVIEAGAIDEAFTHATRIEHVEMLKEIVGGRKMRLHAAGSSLLQEPRARLDAVRPGMAMYRGAVRVAYPLVEVRSGKSPAGYTGFVAENFGVIVRGYSNGLRVGPCIVNGQRRKILEVGMQSAFVELGPTDKVEDEVVLLGDGLTEAEVAAQWGCSEQQALFALARMGGAREDALRKRSG